MLKVAPKNCEAKLFERWWTVKWLGGANIKINLFDGRQWLSRLHFGHSFGAWRCTRGTVGLLHLLDWARMNTFAAVQQICWNNWLRTGHFCALLLPWFQWVDICISKFLDQEFANWVVRYSLVLEKAGVFCHGLQHLT